MQNTSNLISLAVYVRSPLTSHTRTTYFNNYCIVICVDCMQCDDLKCFSIVGLVNFRCDVFVCLYVFDFYLACCILLCVLFTATVSPHNIFGMCDVDLNGILVLRGDVPTRGHRYKVMQEHCINNYRKNFFAQRVAQIWNISHHPSSTSAHSLDLNVR